MSAQATNWGRTVLFAHAPMSSHTAVVGILLPVYALTHRIVVSCGHRHILEHI